MKILIERGRIISGLSQIKYIKFVYLRYTRDREGNSIVMGDYIYPGEPNGQIIVFSSTGVLHWLRERQENGLGSIKRIGVDATFKVISQAILGINKFAIGHSWKLPATTHFKCMDRR